MSPALSELLRLKVTGCLFPVSANPPSAVYLTVMGIKIDWNDHVDKQQMLCLEKPQQSVNITKLNYRDFLTSAKVH